MYINKTYEIIKKIRNGEKVKCPLCKIGEIEPIGDRKETPFFSCSNCHKSMHLLKKALSQLMEDQNTT